MKVAMLIGGLGRGGTESQLIRLAKGLHYRGVTVEVWCYAGASPLDADLEAAGIRVRTGTGTGGQRQKIQQVRGWMQEFKPDVMHGFMKRASSLAILARLGSPGYREVNVVGSDLSTATYAPRRPSLWGSLLLFGFADVVVTQTELNRRSLIRLAPWLRTKVRVIRNGLDLSGFVPSKEKGAEEHQNDKQASSIQSRMWDDSHLSKDEGEVIHKTVKEPPFRFAVVGSVYGVKNPVGLVRAVGILRERGITGFEVVWYGRLGLGEQAESGSPEYHEAIRLVQEGGLEDYVCFKGEISDVQGALQQADALIHPSLQEGFPNAVVEGLACGLPMVLSRVSDLPLVVETAHNGFLVEETNPARIAEGLQQMLDLPVQERKAMGARSRELAGQWFELERFITTYDGLYRELLERN